MKLFGIAFAAVVCAFQVAYAARATPSLVTESFAAAARDDRELTARVASIRRNVVLVLVPGILGSRLESPTEGVIWGDGTPDTAKLKLPAALVDESAPSNVRPSLLKSYFGDQYGDAYRSIETAARKLSISAQACAYDWRRDIRAGAAELERCLAGLGSEPRTLVFIAHSMGGMVTMQWNQLHEQGKYSSQHLVGGIALLGSPLQGSCEVLRLVHDGYTKPTEDALATSKAGYIFGRIDAPLDAGLNFVTSAVTSGIRAALLTWPGAFELTPKAAATDTERYCAKRTVSGNDSDPNLISHFDPKFWDGGIGRDLLNGTKVPPQFPQVLAKAMEFRAQFVVKAPRAPVYAFYSEFWSTPYKAVHRPESGLAFGDQWDEGRGDGRVPFPDGGSRPKDWASEYSVVHSVHGSLPTDQKFREQFLERRLELLVPTLVAYRLIKELGADETVVGRYRRTKGAVPIVDDFISGMDAPDFDGHYRPNPISRLGADIVTTVTNFRRALCEPTGTCAQRLAQVRTPGVTDRAAIASLGGLGESLTITQLELAQARAQVGLAHARQGNLAMASRSLARASAGFEGELPTTVLSAKGRRELESLKSVVDRTLATSLRESGQCVAAKRVLEALLTTTNMYTGDLDQRCYDRDLGIDQTLREF